METLRVIKRETDKVPAIPFAGGDNSIILPRAIRPLFRYFVYSPATRCFSRLPRRRELSRVCTRIDARIEPVAPPRRKHSRPAIYQHQQLALAAFTTLLIRSSINARPWRGVH